MSRVEQTVLKTALAPLVIDHYLQWAKNKIEPIVEQYKLVTMEQVVDEFKLLKVTKNTIGVSIATVILVMIIGKVLGLAAPAAAPQKPKKKKKRELKAKMANRQIQAVLDFVELVYVPQIDEYILNYKQLSDEDVSYKYNYFEEMLLKELMKLDEIDVIGNEVLRENRRKVIKFIQDHQRRLDKFKREVGF